VSADAFLHPRARVDLETVAAWYEGRREGLGGAVIDEFLSCVDRIEGNPESYPAVDGEVRRALLHRFPYAMYYAVEPSHLQILGILHCNQHPDSPKTTACSRQPVIKFACANSMTGWRAADADC
jgi:plasmid stabilization system protein ParE